MTAVTLRTRPSGFASGSSTPTIIERVKRLVQYRRILALLVGRDLKVRYAGSALGYLWTILDPLLLTLVYWFLFTKIFKRSAGPEFEPYMIYLVTGQLPWFWFSGSITATARALRSEAAMVRSSNVPRELWVLRGICSQGIEYIFALPILIAFALIYMKAPTIDIVLLPISWVIEFTMLLGIGLFLAPLTVLVRDIDRVVPIVLRLFYYASPVLYSTTRLPESYQFVYAFNPTTGFLELSHSMFFEAALRWDYVWHSALAAVVLLIIGTFVFVKLERQVLKEI